MIKGETKTELTIETILSKISEVQIFKFYCPDKNWELNKAFCSPLREDKNPSCVIGTKTGKVLYHDFAHKDHSGDCFKFVKILFNLPTLNSVLEKIDYDMDLGIRSSSRGDYTRIVQENKDIEVTKRNTIIQVKTKNFTEEDLQFWTEFYQTKEKLKQANIYSIKELYINKRKYPLIDGEMVFGYFYPPNGWKIYIPKTEDKRRKWLSNIPLDTVEGLENLNKDYNALILKSKKDYLVCREVYQYCCYVQNESLAAFSEETIKYIKENSKLQYYGGDSDVQGKKASYEITETYGFKHINPPDALLTVCCKDFAEMGRVRGLEELKEHFTKKGLYE